MPSDTEAAVLAFMKAPKRGGWRNLIQASGDPAAVQQALVQQVGIGCYYSSHAGERQIIQGLLDGTYHLNDYDLLLGLTEDDIQ